MKRVLTTVILLLSIAGVARANALLAGTNGSAIVTPPSLGPGFFGTTANTLAASSQPACGIFSVPTEVSVDSATLFVNVIGSNFDIGVYNTAGTRVASTGSFTPAVTGRVNVPLTAVTTLGRGTYWQCVVASNAVATISGATVVTTNGTGWQVCTAAAGNFPLPASLAFPCTVTRAAVFNLWLHPVGSPL